MNKFVWVVVWFTEWNRFKDLRVFGSSAAAHAFAGRLKMDNFNTEVYRERVRKSLVIPNSEETRAGVED